jgi:hypothetical protein
VTSQAAFGPPFFLKGTFPFSGSFLTRLKGNVPFKKVNVPSVLSLLLAAVFLGACATERHYDGPPLSKSERAIVRADPVVSAGLPVQLRLRQVDGREIAFSSSAVELAPGAHTFLVDCRVQESGAVSRFVVESELDAGGRYRLVAKASTRNCEAVELIGD